MIVSLPADAAFTICRSMLALILVESAWGQLGIQEGYEAVRAREECLGSSELR